LFHFSNPAIWLLWAADALFCKVAGTIVGTVPSHVGDGQASAEREGERLHAGIKELDLELAVNDWVRLSDQLKRC
jgi:hypothetical protein